MKQYKKVTITFAIISIAIVTISILFGCIKKLPLPVYEKTEEDGTSVYIDGVRYKELPALQWQTNDIDKIIGYAGGYNTLIYCFKNDVDRDFILLKYLYSDLYGPGLYRTDKDIPDVSVDSVDKIVWEYYEIEDGEKSNFYTNTIEDKTIIEEFFGLLKNGRKFDSSEPIKQKSKFYIMDIYLYCSDIPAAYYLLSTGLNNDRIVCGKPIIGYVHIPDDLLEKIAGKKIDSSEFQAG